MKTNSDTTSALYIGLDVHKEKTSVAIADPGAKGEIRLHSVVATTQVALDRLIRRIAKARNRFYLRFTNLRKRHMHHKRIKVAVARELCGVSRGRLAGKKMIGERPAVVERITKEQTEKRTIRLLLSDKERGKTITADNGGEFHGYRRIERAMDTSVYFALPHHAWEPGTNENTNGLIRQYLPKGTPLDDLAQATCTKIAETLNNRPRKRLGFKTPNEIYYRLPVVALQT